MYNVVLNLFFQCFPLTIYGEMVYVVLNTFSIRSLKWACITDALLVLSLARTT